MGKNIAKVLAPVLVATLSILGMMLVLSTIAPLANMARHGFDWRDLSQSCIGAATIAALWSIGKPRSGEDLFFSLAAVFGALMLMDAMTNGSIGRPTSPRWRWRPTPDITPMPAGTPLRLPA